MVNVKKKFYIWDCKCNSTLFINRGKKNHPRSGVFARIFHVGNYGSWKKNKSQNSLTFMLYMKLTSILKLCMQFFELTWFYLNPTPN